MKPPRLHKTRKLTHGQYTAYAVDPLAVRDLGSKVEYTMRECRGPVSIVCPRRKMTKADVPRLTKREVFDYVVRHYLKRRPIPLRVVRASPSSRRRSHAATAVRRAS